MHPKVTFVVPCYKLAHLLPGPAAVGALEDAALIALSPVLPEIGDKNDVGVRRVDADLRNRVRVR